MFKFGSGKKLPSPAPTLPKAPPVDQSRPINCQSCGLRFHVQPVNYGRYEDYNRENYATGL